MAVLGTKSTFMPIELASIIADKARSVCTVSDSGTGSGGTGFLISKDLILTADFVVSSRTDADIASQEFDIEFNRTRDDQEELTTFLDEKPYPWSDPSAILFHSILANAYLADAIRKEKLIGAGVPDAHLIQSGVPPNEAWIQALNVAANMGKTRALYEKALADTNNPGFQEKIKKIPLQTSAIKAKILNLWPEDGFAILKMDIGLSLSPLTLGDAKGLKPDDGVIIVQHPGLGAKAFVLEADGIVGLSNDRIHYNADTMGGASGSPVFDTGMQVIGVHHSAGGPFVNQDGKATRKPNMGLRIDLVKARLKENGLDYLDAS